MIAVDSFRRLGLGLGLGLVLALGAAQIAKADDVVVFAAASLKNALDAVMADWARESGKTAVASYAASSALAKQIEQGAPADLFISADLDWMDYLEGKALIDPATRRNLLGNELVLVGTGAEVKPMEIVPGFDLAGALGDGRLAVGEVTAVPAGRYAKAALTHLGVWDSVSDHLAEAENVRAALVLVSRGEAPLGIVYATDARADKGVGVVGVFPADSHAPIVYPVALTVSSRNPDARSLLEFLETPAAAKVFEAAGFTVPR